MKEEIVFEITEFKYKCKWIGENGSGIIEWLKGVRERETDDSKSKILTAAVEKFNDGNSKLQRDCDINIITNGMNLKQIGVNYGVRIGENLILHEWCHIYTYPEFQDKALNFLSIKGDDREYIFHIKGEQGLINPSEDKIAYYIKYLNQSDIVSPELKDLIVAVLRFAEKNPNCADEVVLTNDNLFSQDEADLN